MPNTLITLITDFGLTDAYVAEMKGVILRINPEAKIVDISHNVEKFNILMGAYILASAVPYFPEGTIHVAVIDPGVGTKRKPILIEANNGFFIGPDNGILALAATKQGIKSVYEITNQKLMLPEISSTFHGRDIFAPAAAFLSKMTPPSEFGSRIHKITMPKFAKIVRKRNMLIGEVIHVDGFGNIITNFTEKELKSASIEKVINIKLRESNLSLKLCKCYVEVKKHAPLAIIGSSNFLEISVNQGNAAEFYKVKPRDTVILYRSS